MKKTNLGLAIIAAILLMSCLSGCAWTQPEIKLSPLAPVMVPDPPTSMKLPGTVTLRQGERVVTKRGERLVTVPADGAAYLPKAALEIIDLNEKAWKFYAQAVNKNVLDYNLTVVEPRNNQIRALSGDQAKSESWSWRRAVDVAINGVRF